jgi:hypothetical protein
MTEHEIINTVEIIKDLFLINQPHAEFQSDEKILKNVEERDLVPLLERVSESLRITPDKNIDGYLEAVRTSELLALDLFFFIKGSEIALHVGPWIRHELFIPGICTISEPGDEGSILVPAFIPVDGAEYPLVTAKNYPDAWRFAPCVFHGYVHRVRRPNKVH